MSHRPALALLALTSCVAPSQADPSRFGTIAVAIAGSADGVYDWQPAQRQALADELVALSALGPAFVLAPEGEADVVVRAAALGGPCGAYRAGAAYVEVDAACAQGTLQLQKAAGHELMHFFLDHRYGSLNHVCDWPLNAPVPPGCDPHVRCPGNDCVLSPGLARVDDGPTWTEAYTGDVADPRPAQGDLDLVAWCQTRGCR